MADGRASRLLGGWRRGRSPAPQPSVRQLLRWMDSSPVGWVLLDGRDRLAHITPRAARILGLETGRHLEGRPLEELCDHAALAGSIAIARRQDRAQRLQWRLEQDDYDVVVMPGLEGWIAVQFQSRRSLEAQLEQQERWVSDVAHELKTPLTALLLVGDSLAAQVNERNARLVERLQRELLRLQDLVGNLLELSRLENTLPGEGMGLGEVDLGRLVEQVWQGLRPLAEARGIHLHLVAPAPVAIEADQARLHRAILNLLDNGVRYSPDGMALEASLSSRGGWCQLSIRDHGPGLGEEDLAHMFERFYRGDPSRVRSQRSGSGLGLAIVQQIAVTHGGRIQAGNHPGGGAQLDLILPLRQGGGGDRGRPDPSPPQPA